MKQFRPLFALLFVTFISILLANPVSSKTLYDDFSGGLLSSDRWYDQEFVVEVVNGKLVSKINNGPGSIPRNRTTFFSYPPIHTIQSEIKLVETSLDDGRGFARIEGYFYNTQNNLYDPAGNLVNSGVNGDIWCDLIIYDVGTDIVARYFILEALDDGWTTWKDIDNLVFARGLNKNETYVVKIAYNENNNSLTFHLKKSNLDYSHIAHDL